MKQLFESPKREYIVIAIVLLALIINVVAPKTILILWIFTIIGAIPVAVRTLQSIAKRKITIDTFNVFAIIISFAAIEIRSAAFIILMLAFADLLEWRTTTRTHRATEELLKLKPLKASKETNNIIEEIPIDSVQSGDILVVKNGARIPVDGIVVYGSALINESSVTGESSLFEKVHGDTVLSSTLNESGTIKIKATNVGKDSTIEQMVTLMKQAAQNKSKSEKLADRFAKIFLPLVILLGTITYIITKNITMTAAIFLVACADDMAVAIPLAMTASIGNAAKKGVIVKGGEFLDTLHKMKILVIDKTGTLTYGRLSVQNTTREPIVEENNFWKLVAAAEKFSEHPISRALVHEAKKYIENFPDPDQFEPYKGSGVWARLGNDEIIIGDLEVLMKKNIIVTDDMKSKFLNETQKFGQTTVLVFINNLFAGLIVIADIPRSEAKKSIENLKHLGVERIIMFTGDNEIIAQKTAHMLGISEVRANMKPEDKLNALEMLTHEGVVGMIGDGINDAPTLSRADVGIAMGSGGTAVAIEAADIVILTDNLARIPEMIMLSKKTVSVIKLNIAIWLISNVTGFALVFTGIAGPALAAFYNFATDFFPLINSGRLFRK